MNIRFAFAVNKANFFEKKHFGDADKYLIYEQHSDKLILISEETNTFKLLDEEQEHGSRRKGNAIINFLKGKKANALVSMQFCKNIKMINRHFIPVKVTVEHPDEIIGLIEKHLHWIQDEWERNSSDYKLFTISSGVMKSAIENKSEILKKSIT